MFYFISNFILHLLPLILYGYLIIGILIISDKTKIIDIKHKNNESEKEYNKQLKLKDCVYFISFFVFIFNFIKYFEKFADFIKSYF